MISGAHIVIHSTNPEADRSFFRDVLQFPNVDAGQGWLIFALPASELAVHPAKENGKHELYLLASNLPETIETLKAAGTACEDVIEVPWGSLTKITLPGGGQVGLYQPKHPQP